MRAGRLDEPVRVRAGTRPDHEQQVDLSEHCLDGVLAVRRRVADVLPLRRLDTGETTAQHLDDLGRFVDRERRLRQVCDPLCLRRRNALGVLDRFDEEDRDWRLPGRALDLLVAGVSDQDDRVVVSRVMTRFGMYLGDEWAGRVDCLQAAGLGALTDGRADSVG
jgi:hypothetical protein